MSATRLPPFLKISQPKTLENLRRNQALQAALEAAHKDSATGLQQVFHRGYYRDKLSESDGELCLLLILDIDLLKTSTTHTGTLSVI